MEFLDLNLPEVSYEPPNNLSEMSFNTDISSKSQSGGLFWNNNTVSKVDKAILEAARLKKFDVVEFMIKENLMANYGSKDESGNTLLHYLLNCANPQEDIIDCILSRKDTKSFVNVQNKDGDTPLIVAVKNGHHDLCTKLIEHGANKSIKNNEGLGVDTETEMMTSSSKGIVISITKSDIGEEIKNIINPLELLIKGKTQNTSEPPTEFMGTEMRSEPHTDDFIKKMMRKWSPKEKVQKIRTNVKEMSENATDRLLVRIDDYIKKHKENKTQEGGDCGCGSNDTDRLINSIENYFHKSQNKNQNSMGDTDKLINSIEQYFGQKGGKKIKKRVSGKRKVNKYSERLYEGGVTSSEDDDYKYDRENELSRLVHNQTSEIINRVVKSIMEIMDVDEETAKAYKAALWAEAKKEDLKSSMDVAIKMSEMAKKDILKKINVQEWKDKLKAHYEEKTKKNTSTESETSSVPVPSDSSFVSSTSI